MPNKHYDNVSFVKSNQYANLNSVKRQNLHRYRLKNCHFFYYLFDNRSPGACASPHSTIELKYVFLNGYFSSECDNGNLILARLLVDSKLSLGGLVPFVARCDVNRTNTIEVFKYVCLLEHFISILDVVAVDVLFIFANF